MKNISNSAIFIFINFDGKRIGHNRSISIYMRLPV